MVKKYYRAKEAAKYLGVSRNTIWLWSKKLKIHPIKLSSGVTVFDIDELNHFMYKSAVS